MHAPSFQVEKPEVAAKIGRAYNAGYAVRSIADWRGMEKNAESGTRQRHGGEAMTKTTVRACLAIGALFAGPSAYADIAFKALGGELYEVHISGAIAQADPKMLASHIKVVQAENKRDPIYIVYLDSRGGNVDGALRLGRILRKLGVLAHVTSDSVCLSSCVYVLAGAESRNVQGKVGIHRAYEPNDQTMSTAKQKAKYDAAGKHVLAYLKEMHIPARLYEDSLYVSPENIKILSRDDLVTYGLSVNDPYSDESNAVKEAQRLGISRKELAARMPLVKVRCSTDQVETSKERFLAYLACRDSVLKGGH